MTPKMLDLFSGIGGFSLTGKWAGFETIHFVEKDLFCQKVLKKNFPNIPIHDDIKTFYCSNKIDLLTAGLPCQPFSVAGKQKGRDDDRYLWPDTLRIIRESKPSFVLLENVPGIIKLELDNIIDDLEREAYSVSQYLIPASAAKAPHKRERIWIVAYCNRKRCFYGNGDRERRQLQNYLNRNVAPIQSEWEKFKPKSWETYEVENWLQYNASHGRKNDGLSTKLDVNRIKSLGNSIVPQVVYPIIKFIYDYLTNK